MNDSVLPASLSLSHALKAIVTRNLAEGEREVHRSGIVNGSV